MGNQCENPYFYAAFLGRKKKWVIGYRRKKKWVISVKTLILRGFFKGKRDVLPIAKTRGSMAIKNNLYILMNMFIINI